MHAWGVRVFSGQAGLSPTPWERQREGGFCRLPAANLLFLLPTDPHWPPTAPVCRYLDMRYLAEGRAALEYDLPLAEVVTGLFDAVKSRSRGYASLDYALTGATLSAGFGHGGVMLFPRRSSAHGLFLFPRAHAPWCRPLPPALPLHFPNPQTQGKSKQGSLTLRSPFKHAGWREGDLVLLEMAINGEPAPPLACIVHRAAAAGTGRALARALKELIPRQQFRVPLQAMLGSRVIAAEAIPAARKDVLAKCYGGDISRKKKLLKKQAKGKKRMKARVDGWMGGRGILCMCGLGGGPWGAAPEAGLRRDARVPAQTARREGLRGTGPVAHYPMPTLSSQCTHACTQMFGKVEVPQEAFMAVLQLSREGTG